VRNLRAGAYTFENLAIGGIRLQSRPMVIMDGWPDSAVLLMDAIIFQGLGCVGDLQAAVKTYPLSSTGSKQELRVCLDRSVCLSY
jgi:hypothetical protein